MNIGVILSRCQPLHKGHIEMINRALAEMIRFFSLLVVLTNQVQKEILFL